MTQALHSKEPTASREKGLMGQGDSDNRCIKQLVKDTKKEPMGSHAHTLIHVQRDGSGLGHKQDQHGPSSCPCCPHLRVS